jgi:hypothetical protein
MFSGDLNAVLLKASNSTCDAGLVDVPPPWQEIQPRKAVLHESIHDLFTEQKAVQSRLISELPILSSEFVEPLIHLDQQLSFHDAGVCHWLQHIFHDRRRVGTQEGEWVDGEQYFCAAVQFSHELDAETAGIKGLGLSLWFPGTCFKSMRATNAKRRPFVEYQHWHGQSLVNRPEAQSLTSELLRALLERIPELAFVVGYATSVILTLKGRGGAGWRPYFRNPQGKADSNG